jgi:hypothetical protein
MTTLQPKYRVIRRTPTGKQQILFTGLTDVDRLILRSVEFFRNHPEISFEVESEDFAPGLVPRSPLAKSA